MEEIVITRITQENPEELLDIAPLKQADDNECLERSDITSDQALRKIEDLYARGADVWVARIKGTQEAIGYALGSIIEYSGEFHYRSLGIFVIQRLRGRRIAEILREAQTTYAKGWGCTKIISNVRGANTSSIAFLRRTGFTLTPQGDGFLVEKPIK